MPRGFARGRGCGWSGQTENREDLGDGMVLPAQVFGEATWLLNSAGFFSPPLRNAVFSSLPACAWQFKASFLTIIMMHKVQYFDPQTITELFSGDNKKVQSEALEEPDDS